MPDTLNNFQWPKEEYISGLEVYLWDRTLQKPGRKALMEDLRQEKD